MRFLAVFKPFSAFCCFLDLVAESAAVRSMERMFLYIHKLLILNSFAILLFFGSAQAQVSNHDMVFSLMRECAKACERPVRSVQGFRADEVSDFVKLDTASDFLFMVELPVVEYDRIDKGHYRRNLEVTCLVQSQDSIIATIVKYKVDTVPSEQWKAIRKGAEPEERGSDPRRLSRFWLPATTVFTGLAGIIALFYVRSK